jgi:MFS family permease
MKALRAREFRRLWFAGLISDTGDWLLLVSLPILVYQLTGSTLGTAYAFLVELAPFILLAPVAGVLADRLDRRRLLVAVSAAQAAALLPLLWRPDLPVVYAVIAVEAALASLFDPAKNALLPTLVGPDDLVSANSLVGLNQNLGRLLGGPLGGLLLAAGDLRVIVAADVASFLLALVLIAGLHPAPPPATGTDAAGAARAAATAPGGRPFGRRPVRVGLLVVAVASVAQGLFVVLFVVFVARALHGDAAETGLLRGVQGIGAIAGGLLLAFAARIRPGRLAGLACLAFGLLSLAVWNAPRLTTAPPLYVALFVAVGAPGVAMMTGVSTVLQTSTVDGERGRVFAALGVVAAAGQAVGMVAAGLLGDRLGVVTVLNGQGCMYLLAGLLALAWLADRGAARPPGPVAAVPAQPGAGRVNGAPGSAHDGSTSTVTSSPA